MRRSGLLLVMLVAPLLPFLLSAPARAAEPRLGLLDASVYSSPVWESADPDATMPVVVELEGPTAFDLYRQTPHKLGESTIQADTARDAAFATVEAAQAPALSFVEAVGATIVSTYDSAMNGFLVLATRDQVERLTLAPGVRAVYRAPEHHLLLNNAVPLVGAEQVMQQLGYTGKNVTIAVVDQGIDYTHKSLGGSGRVKDYQDNNPSIVEPRSFPTDKVIGGYDFAGSNYTGGNQPTPDPDPLDEADHGTHVSGIAAGMTGNSKVFHGVAPDAKLIALKVFGRGGSTSLSTDAIEWAIEANMGRSVPGACQMPGGVRCRVDVLNMSLGAAWANGVMEQAGAVRRAVEAGIVLVAAAGNDDDIPFIHGAPAASPQALAVANTYHGGLKGDVVQATYGGKTYDIEALEGSTDANGQQRLGKAMSTVGELVGPLASFGRGCNADQATAPDVTTKVALVERGVCSFSEKVANAAAKGATAVVVYNNQPGIITMGPTAGIQSDQIPAYLIRQADGQTLKQQLDGGNGVRARMAKALNGTFIRTYLADVIGPGSSRGPSRAGAFKPNISAPGTEIFAPKRSEGDAGVSYTGTSMASPMVAGGAAVLIERLRHDGLAPVDAPLTDPTKLTAADIGAMLMNYADARVYPDDNRVPPPVPLARQGAGRMNVLKAVQGKTLVRAGNFAEIDFGIHAVLDQYTDRATVSIRNLSDAPKQYQLSTEFNTPEEATMGVAYGASPATLTLGAGESTAASVDVTVTGSGLPAYAAYGGASTMQPDPIAQAEVDGFLVVTEVRSDGAAPDIVRVPIYFLPRPASAIAVSPSPVLISPTIGTGTVTLENEAPGEGIAHLFAYGGPDGQESGLDPRLDFDQAGAQLGTDNQWRRVLAFALHTRAPLRTPIDTTPWALIDANGDGSYDWGAHALNVGGEFVTAVRQITSQSPLLFARQYAADFEADVNVDSSTIILHVLADRIGITTGNPVAVKYAILIVANFSDVAGGMNAPAIDFAPDDALVEGPNGSLSAGPGRYALDADALGYAFDRSDLQLAGMATDSVTIRRVPGKSLDGQKILALMPWNPPSSGDLQVLEIRESEAPTNTPIPYPTDAPTPEGRQELVFLPVAVSGYDFGASGP